MTYKLIFLFKINDLQTSTWKEKKALEHVDEGMSYSRAQADCRLSEGYEGRLHVPLNTIYVEGINVS